MISGISSYWFKFSVNFLTKLLTSKTTSKKLYFFALSSYANEQMYNFNIEHKSASPFAQNQLQPSPLTLSKRTENISCVRTLVGQFTILTINIKRRLLLVLEKKKIRYSYGRNILTLIFDLPLLSRSLNSLQLASHRNSRNIFFCLQLSLLHLSNKINHSYCY